MNSLFRFPETIFVELNTNSEQLKHIISEAIEALESYVGGYPKEETTMELWDIIQSAETALRKQQKFGVDLENARKAVIVKNMNKKGGSYYVDELQAYECMCGEGSESDEGSGE